MYYAMRASAPSLHRESTDSLILIFYWYIWMYVVPPMVMVIGQWQ